jgi:hypothetical protein
MVPPAYYAQLAAERGHVLAQGRSLLGDEAAAAAATAGDGAAEGAAAVAEGDEVAAAGVSPEFDVRVNVRLGGSMYYV